MKFLAEILVIVAFISAFIYAVGLIFGKEKKKTALPLDDLDAKADTIVKERDEVEKAADEVEKKASGIKEKINSKKK
jgi:chaperonin cofactor prefoldin